MPKTSDEDARFGIRPTSLVGQIAGLEPGDSMCRSRRFDGDTSRKNDIRDWLRNTRNTLATALGRARNETGGDFAMESGDFRTSSFDVIACVVVTRLK